MDETWVGGRTRGEGRGVHHKVPVSCAIEVRHRKPGTKLDNRKDGRYAGRVRLAVVLVFANLKTWLIGIHHGVSHQHLQAYLNEFTFRFNRRFYPFNAFRSLLGIAGDTSAPTYAELYSGEWRHPTCSGHGR